MKSEFDILFDGDESLFKKSLFLSRIYGEYGCGSSTSWVLSNCYAIVYSVDTSVKWVKDISLKNIQYKSKLNLKHIDLGDVGKWGRPINYSKRHKFINYTNWIWEQRKKPDTVLIDGRFRVCCFLTSLMLADEGTKIIFDDYINRPSYHIIENYVKREETFGRQCLFLVPKKDKLDIEKLEIDIKNFRYVMD
tara:strand:- start:422 stop:997 length:576 start_codon:yes stop_codon:yes gene_type:complete